MNNTEYNEIITRYYNDVCEAYKLGNIESSYYSPITRLFTSIGCAPRDLSGERRGISGENIDIKLWHNEEEVTIVEPFAGIEVKKVKGIDKRAMSQIKAEAQLYGNAILTDNLEWRFYRANEDHMYTGLRIIELENDELTLVTENVELFFSLIEDFLLKDPAQIKSSTKLAEYMAMHARTIRSIITGILRVDENGQPILDENQEKIPMFKELYALYNRIKKDLRPLMGTKEFSDMYAQTIVYGLFIARYNDTSKDTFDKYEAIGNLQNESDLLKQFFMHIAGTGKRHPTLDGVIDKLCALYKICDIQTLLDKDERKDTIVHFYEEFLSYYDPALRKSLGVFYTPIQAVRYLIRFVDMLLVKELHINGGLSNNDYISIQVPCAPYENTRKKLIDKIKIEVPRVAILDPACGTGSFGSEIIKYIKDIYFAGGKAAFYEQYIQDSKGLLSRLIAFEIMMTSYVVAHLKMRRTIDATMGKSPETQLPINIFLTNTLAPIRSIYEKNNQAHLFDLFDFSGAITEEAYKADTWKARRPIKIIIGNPPYLAASTNPYDVSAYKTETDGVTPFGERKHWLNDDYVKFFRFAEEIIDKNDNGILAYVSNNGYLDNPTFRGMRASLLRSFDKIWIVNLHGSANKKETAPDGSKDENIFEIMQGVALFIGLKTSKSTSWAKVYYTDIWGTRDKKLGILEEGNTEFEEIHIDPQMAYFIPFGNDEEKETYNKGISIAELFPTNVTGIVSGRDDVAIADTYEELTKRLSIVQNSISDKPIDELWGQYSRGQSAEKIRNDTLNGGKITRIAFRPFDDRWTYYSGTSCGWILWPREKATMGHLLNDSSSPIGDNIGLVFCKTSRSFFSPFVTKNIIAHRLFSAMCEITYVAPLYKCYETEITGTEWSVNLNEEKVHELVQYLSETPEPIDIFNYIYAILHDPSYCEKYNEYLSRDFPRVPIINVPEAKRSKEEFYVSEEMFVEYVKAGDRLHKLHLLDEKIQFPLTLEPAMPDNMTIEFVKYKKGVLQINSVTRIIGIPQCVWDYQIGGHQVLDKWFKEHKGKSLTLEYYSHVENICGCLDETIQIREYLRNLHE